MLEYGINQAGCGFQKFAQWLSMRPDKFHPDFIKVCSNFREGSPSHSLQETKDIFKQDFGMEIEDVFEVFDETPLASGSIAQVHRAIIKEEYANPELKSREVAIKVRHPATIIDSYTDPSIILNFCEWSFSILNTIMPFDRQKVEHSLKKQVDLSVELENLQRFNKYFKDDPNVTFPKPYTKFCSSSVLVESFHHGDSVGDMMSSFKDDAFGYEWEDIQSVNQDVTPEFKSKLADKIFDCGMKMYVRDNFAHADLHAGNLLAKRDGKLIVLDTGLTTELNPKDNDKFFDFLEKGITLDVPGFTTLLMYFNSGDNAKAVDRPKLESDIQDLMDLHLNKEAGR
eukprot:UN32638